MPCCPVESFGPGLQAITQVHHKCTWKLVESLYFNYADYDSEFINSSLQEQTPFSALVSPGKTRAEKGMQMLPDL